jgi:uncharacterized membrane protein YphA (DoxX/SURF4 family)
MKTYILTTTRILLGGILILYAYAKFSGNQFVKLELNENIDNIEPALLVFYFFGYSQTYAKFCAVAELITGLLTAIPRTSHIGVLIYFPFTLNIAVMDWCFDFPLETKLLISSLTLLSFLLIVADWKFYIDILGKKRLNET